MTLYTICVLDQPTVVVSAGVLPDPENGMMLDHKIVKTLRDLDKRRLKFEPEVAGRRVDDLGARWPPLWSGDRAEICIRDATIEETSKWYATFEDAVDEGEQAAGDNRWLVFLVSDLVNPTDAYGQDDEEEDD